MVDVGVRGVLMGYFYGWVVLYCWLEVLNIYDYFLL